MTPTSWLGLAAICAVAGFCGSTLMRGAGMAMYFGRLTTAVEMLTNSVTEIKALVHESNKSQAMRFEEHEGRLSKLEFCLDMDGRSEGIVMDVMKIRNRQRRRGDNRGGQEA
jgi:hypothetical protein